MVKSSSFQHSGKKLINSLVNTHTRVVRPVKSFLLKSGMEFQARSSNVFNKLNALEMNHDAWMSENETHDSFDLNNNSSPPVTSDVFKKPFVPVACKRKGGHLPNKNMKKWIKYSLKDVEISSDETNSAVALQFLDELRRKKEKNFEEVTSSDDKVIFRKPHNRSHNVSNSVVSASASDNENLEHYSQFEKVSANKLKTPGSNIKLFHLQDHVGDA